MRILRLALTGLFGMLLIAASTIPLLQVVAWSGMYFAAAMNQFYTPVAEATKYHFFDNRALSLLRPAIPYFLILLLLQCGAAYALSVLLSRSTLSRSRAFAWGLCLSAVTTIVVTTVVRVHFAN